jgi:hypothetical protein
MTRSTQRRGIAAPAVALSLIVLLGVLALAVDGGQLMGDRRQAQAAADAAALAAASDLYDQMVTYWPNNPGRDGAGETARKSAFTTATQNGYKKSHVTVNVAAGTYSEGATAGQALPDGYAEVIILGKQKRAFSNIFGSGNLSIHARAVARARYTIYTDYGIIVLDPSSKASLKVTGGGLSVLGSSPVAVNSTDPAGLFLSGTGSLTADLINVTGGSSLSGQAQLNATVHYGTPPVADPLANLRPPDPKTMTTQSYSGGDATLDPGVYNSGISLSSGAQVTLNPGIYYVNGLKLTAQSTLTGDGVMIYNTGGLDLKGQSSLNLSPPTTGTYAGMSYFQDRNSPAGDNLSGGSTTSISGTFYAPNATVDNTGAADCTIGSQFIARQLVVAGSGDFTVNYDKYTIIRKRDIRLVE